MKSHVSATLCGIALVTALSACADGRPDVVPTTEHMSRESGDTFNPLADFAFRNAATMDECYDQMADPITVLNREGNTNKFVAIARLRDNPADEEGLPNLPQVRAWFEEIGAHCQEGLGPYALYCSYTGGPIFHTDEFLPQAAGAQTYEFVGVIAKEHQPWSWRWGRSVLAYRKVGDWEPAARRAESQCRKIGLGSCDTITWERTSLTHDQCKLDKTPLFRMIEINEQTGNRRLEGYGRSFYDHNQYNPVPVEKATTEEPVEELAVHSASGHLEDKQPGPIDAPVDAAGAESAPIAPKAATQPAPIDQPVKAAEPAAEAKVAPVKLRNKPIDLVDPPAAKTSTDMDGGLPMPVAPVN